VAQVGLTVSASRYVQCHIQPNSTWQIIGAGAIGCLWAANLLNIGQQVHLITRNKQSHQVLDYLDIQGNKTRYDCPNSTQLINATSPILVCVKAPQVKQALLQQIEYIGKQQVIILMHNGMGSAEQVAELLPSNPIICATTANASLLHSPLHIQQTGLGMTYLGAFNEQAKPYAGLASVLNNALGNCHWCANIEEKLWLKLLINIAINPLTALHQVNNGKLAEPPFQAQIETMVEEAITLVTKLGLHFKNSELLQTINSVIHATASNYSSMNRDLHFKRHTENDYISGYLLAKASQHNIETPLIAELYNRVKAIEYRSLAPSDIR